MKLVIPIHGTTNNDKCLNAKLTNASKYLYSQEYLGSSYVKGWKELLNIRLLIGSESMDYVLEFENNEDMVAFLLRF